MRRDDNNLPPPWPTRCLRLDPPAPPPPPVTYNYGVEKYELGTAFGHIAISVPDVAAACERTKARRSSGADPTPWATRVESARDALRSYLCVNYRR